MKLLFLSKRRPQNRDLIERPYGRFYNLPVQMAMQGHEVRVLLADYQAGPSLDTRQDGVQWYSRALLTNPFQYYRQAKRLIQEHDIDWVIGCSDTYYGIMASQLGSSTGCKSLIDAYDNYEAYIGWAKPLHALWRRAISRADAVTAAGPGLLQKMVPHDYAGIARVVPMAADDSFSATDKVLARQALNLPADKQLIGYCGSAEKSRGISQFLEIVETLADTRPEVQFLFSGRVDPSLNLPGNATHLGFLDDALMPAMVNALDVAVAYNLSSSFGEYSHPVKIYEALSCGVPVLASRTQATQWMLDASPQYLFDSQQAQDFIGKLTMILDGPAQAIDCPARWCDVAAQFSSCIAPG